MTTAKFEVDDVVVFSRVARLNLSMERITQIVEEMGGLSESLARLGEMNLLDYYPTSQLRLGGNNWPDHQN